MIEKRGQGLPINVIILAIIALVVLAVLIFIFTRNVNTFSGDTQRCSFRGGECKEKACDSNTQQLIEGTDCKAPKPNCCLTVLRGGK